MFKFWPERHPNLIIGMAAHAIHLDAERTLLTPLKFSVSQFDLTMRFLTPF